MKRLCVAGLIFKPMQKFEPPRRRSITNFLLLGRRGKEPNKGMWVLPGGGVEDGETLDQAFCREILEETGLVLQPEASRFYSPRVIELEDRIIIVSETHIKGNRLPVIKSGSDLYDVGWYDRDKLPDNLSPVISPLLSGLFNSPRYKLR